MRQPDWASAFPETRHLLRVVAADSARRTDAVVFSHASAAVLRELPLFRFQPGAVHVAGLHTDGVARTGPLVRHHEVAVPESDRDVVDGIPCTTLERTVFDLIRTTPRETAVAIADAALRLIAYNSGDRTYDEVAADTWRARLHLRIARSTGARGIRQARWIAAFADGRAQLPGESVSRLYLSDLGFAPPRLQVPFPGPNGELLAIDFGLDDVGAWGEFDGEGKYFDPSILGSQTTRQTFAKEKEREDWIRGRSSRRFVRWGMPHIATPAALSQRLSLFGLTPTR
ncbi:hypothetical protein ABZ477_13195 [Microbacterium sp. NPDC019599]|uniref:hypothetical protein n=1 Tax=Microbacterium sp. NPDC019599 TaxID=3154690 RepID=UPI0033F7FD7B